VTMSYVDISEGLTTRLPSQVSAVGSSRLNYPVSPKQDMILTPQTFVGMNGRAKKTSR